MTDLHTNYLGMKLRSPLVASAGPYTGDLDQLAQLQDAGAGAVVLPSLFEEQIEHETSEIDRLFSLHQDSFGEASSFFPEIDDYNTGTDTYLALVEAAKFRVGHPGDRQPQRHQHRRLVALRTIDRGCRRRRDRTQLVHGRRRPGGQRRPNSKPSNSNSSPS